MRAEHLYAFGVLMAVAGADLVVKAQSETTRQCLEVAGDRDCTVFNKCCDFKCRYYDENHRRDHFCMALFGRIQKSECVCNSAASPRHRPAPKFGVPYMDLVVGVMLLFAVDFALLTFTL